VVAAAGLHVVDGRVVRPGAARANPQDLHPGIRTLVARLADAPFAAPERDELAALGLGPRQLAAAEKAGLLLRVGPDLAVAPDAAERAVALLIGLTQPFTTSTARQTLGVTRRIAIPLLEHLDERGLTVRVDGTSRTVVR
jgi:selenocysteine-specific elongation factor